MAPTVSIVIGPPFFQKYWWLRSPNTYTDGINGVWRVRSSGVIGIHSNVSDSYGCTSSPDMSYDYILDNRNFVIEWDGSIDGLNDPDVSYGAWLRSPTTGVDAYAYSVTPDGDLTQRSPITVSNRR